MKKMSLSWSPEPNSFLSFYQHKTGVQKLNVKVVYTEYNKFNSLPSRSSAITTAWVMRQSSDNEKLEKQKKNIKLSVFIVQYLIIRSSSYKSDLTYKKSPRINDTIYKT